MKNLREVKRLKIVEQIILVLLLAVIVPTIVCAFIVNNINQHAVRNELQYSAMNIAESIASNINTMANSGEDELNQIVLTMKHIKSDYAREVYLKDILIHSDMLSNIELVQKKDKNKYLQWEDYSKLNKESNKIEIFKRINDAEGIIATINVDVFENKVFNIYKKDSRQIYVLNEDKKVIASHNYNQKDFEKTISTMPKGLKVGEPIIFGKIKNQPLAYYKIKNPDITIVVNTTHYITKTTINTARYKILLALIASAFFIILIVGVYTSYLYINIRQLFKGIMALTKGNYKRKLRLINNAFTPYEIVFLEKEFNKMADEVNNTYKKLQHSNKELKKLDEFRANLIDTVSHEFRTPLTSIKGYTSRLLRQDIEIDDEMKQKSLKIIKNQSERLSRMVEDLLVIPDIEGAKLNLVLDSVNLNDSIEDAILSIQHKDKGNHDVKVNIAEDFPNVIADNDRLEQILINLIENAYKYAYPETMINVDVQQDKQFAVISVSNAYDYIPPEQLQKLYGKFIRIDDKTTRTTRGTGLGLFIVKGLIKAMNGSIELCSTQDNEFKVTIKLPLA